MPKLVVNPGSPDVWGIQLKQGTNSIGRGPANDVTFDDPSVSGSHCEIRVDGDSVSIKDLGSTNGTFVNRTQVQEAQLQPGQQIRLGSVEMVFHSDAAEPATARDSHPMRLHIANLSAPRSALAVAPPPVPTEVHVPPPPPPAPGADGGRRVCKFHPKSVARYLCTKCNRSFCELCVTSRSVGGTVRKTCRTCGVEVMPLQARLERPAKARGFFARLPGVVIYPFRGSGVLILIVATLVFAGLAFMSMGWMSLLMRVIALGYLFSFMQNIIQSTAAEDEEMPSLPEPDELIGSCFRFAGTVLMAFGVAIGLVVARFFEVEIPMAAIIAALVFGCLYFPMAFLAVAMKDTVAASNPLIVVPAIVKVPLEYVVTVILMGSIFGFQKLGDIASGVAGSVTFSTRDTSVLVIALAVKAAWSFISVYLLTVNMRILGLLYLTKKDKLAWFSH